MNLSHISTNIPGKQWSSKYFRLKNLFTSVLLERVVKQKSSKRKLISHCFQNHLLFLFYSFPHYKKPETYIPKKCHCLYISKCFFVFQSIVIQWSITKWKIIGIEFKFFCVLAVCNPDCDNGDCTAPDNCTCHEGWTGSICNQRKYQTYMYILHTDSCSVETDFLTIFYRFKS